jgi:hypothetical protein
VGVRVWDVASDRPVEPLPSGIGDRTFGQVAFSPDGRWLVDGWQANYLIRRVGHWEEIPHILPRENPGSDAAPAAFSPDSRLLAIAHTPVEVQLIDLTTFEEVARLLAPGAQYITRMRFSPDGSCLAVATENDKRIQLWDLRAIRRKLQQLGLDWELPPYPPEGPQTSDHLHLVLLPDQIEAENLLVVTTERCRFDMRDTSARRQGVWSNDRELVGEAELGGYLEVEIDAPRTGNYTLGITFTQAPEFGIVAVSVDGKCVGEPFDGFAEKVCRCEKDAFGRLALMEGRHRLRFTAVGRNPRASAFHFAVDCLTLRPEKD